MLFGSTDGKLSFSKSIQTAGKLNKKARCFEKYLDFTCPADVSGRGVKRI